MKLMRRAVMIVIVLFSCVGCDQVSKTIAGQALAEAETMSFLGDLFRLQYTENPGAFLSFGANMSEEFKYWVFIISVGVCLAGMLVYMLASNTLSKAQIMAFSLMLGGGAGNLVDRIFNEGRVIDFLNIGVGSLRTGVFNVADVAITVGSVWFFVHSFKKPQRVP
jgi:signal peptidase II